MNDRPMAISANVVRACARLAVAFCLVVFGLAAVLERAHEVHAASPVSTLAVAVAGELHEANVDGQAGGDVDRGSDAVGHGCHGCAAIPAPFLQSAAIPDILSASLGWVAAPSATSRAPLIDLRPPRA